MSEIIVTNLKRDTIDFHTVYEGGKKPTRTKDGKVKDPGGTEFKLALGSSIDANIEGELQPEQAIPEWALPELRKIPVFVHLEETNHIKVAIPA